MESERFFVRGSNVVFHFLIIVDRKYRSILCIHKYILYILVSVIDSKVL